MGIAFIDKSVTKALFFESNYYFLDYLTLPVVFNVILHLHPIFVIIRLCFPSVGNLKVFRKNGGAMFNILT